MTRYDTSILIPSRNEMFLAKTIEDLLQNIRGKTEIIAVLDGQWRNPASMTTKTLPSFITRRALANEPRRMKRRVSAVPSM